MSSVPCDPVTIDDGGRARVSLLLELRARISGLPGGTVVQLIASDPAAPVDLAARCRLTGHAHLGPVLGRAKRRLGGHRRGGHPELPVRRGEAAAVLAAAAWPRDWRADPVIGLLIAAAGRASAPRGDDCR